VWLGWSSVRAVCPSSGARDYNIDYHIGRFVLGNQLYSRELLMMDMVVPETC